MARWQPRPLNRRTPTREPKRKFVIFCEGRNTEPHYFRALMREYRTSLVELEIVEAAGVPITIANAAAERVKTDRGRRKQAVEADDQVWAVFDRDRHARHDEAVRLCEQANVRVGRSNPCFELWLVLHEEEYGRQDDHRQIQEHLRKLRPDYDPSGAKMLDFANLVQRVEDAEKWAAKLLAAREAEGDAFGRPSTTILHLTRAIRGASA